MESSGPIDSRFAVWSLPVIHCGAFFVYYGGYSQLLAALHVRHAFHDEPSSVMLLFLFFLSKQPIGFILRKPNFAWCSLQMINSLKAYKLRLLLSACFANAIQFCICFPYHIRGFCYSLEGFFNPSIPLLLLVSVLPFLLQLLMLLSC